MVLTDRRIVNQAIDASPAIKYVADKRVHPRRVRRIERGKTESIGKLLLERVRLKRRFPSKRSYGAPTLETVLHEHQSETARAATYDDCLRFHQLSSDFKFAVAGIDGRTFQKRGT